MKLINLKRCLTSFVLLCTTLSIGLPAVAADPISINLSASPYMGGSYATATFTTNNPLKTAVGHNLATLSLIIVRTASNGAASTYEIKRKVTADTLSKYLMHKESGGVHTYTLVISNYEGELSPFGNMLKLNDGTNNVTFAQSATFKQKIPIVVNQLGYRPKQAKTAYIYTPQPILSYDAFTDYAQGNQWNITLYKPVNGGRVSVWSRTYDDANLLTALMSTGSKDVATGYYVYEINFHDLEAEGSKLYFSISDKNGSTLPFGSYPFDISSNTVMNQKYLGMANDALKYFYFHRLGWNIEATYLSPAENYATSAERDIAAAKHAHNAFDGFAVPCFKDIACAQGVTLPAQQAWADAGDFGVYPVNTAAAAWQLMNIVEFDEAASRSINASLPEIQYQRVAVGETAEASALMKEVLAGTQYLYAIDPATVHNMPHKIHSQDWNTLSQWEPETEWGVSAAANDEQDYSHRSATVGSTAASYAACRVMAQASRIMLMNTSTQFPEVRDLQTAYLNRAVQWYMEATDEPVKLYPSSYTQADFSIGGGPYGDKDILDDQFACYVELYLAWYALTPENEATKAWEDKVSSHPLFSQPEVEYGVDYWSHSLTMANLSLLSAPHTHSGAVNSLKWSVHKLNTIKSLEDVYELLISKVMGSATAAENPAPRSNSTWPWASNAEALNYVMLLNYYIKFGTTDAVKKANAGHIANEILSYVLGANVQNKSFVTGYGSNPETDTHDRMAWWALDSAGIKYPKGWISGGPMTDIASCMSGGEVNVNGDSTWERGTPFWKTGTNGFEDGKNDDTDNKRLTDGLIGVHEAYNAIFTTATGDMKGQDLIKLLSQAVKDSNPYPTFSVGSRIKPALSYAKAYTAPWSWCSKENAINYNSALVWAAFAASQNMTGALSN